MAAILSRPQCVKAISETYTSDCKEAHHTQSSQNVIFSLTMSHKNSLREYRKSAEVWPLEIVDP